MNENLFVHRITSFELSFLTPLMGKKNLFSENLLMEPAIIMTFQALIEIRESCAHFLQSLQDILTVGYNFDGIAKIFQKRVTSMGSFSRLIEKNPEALHCLKKYNNHIAVYLAEAPLAEECVTIESVLLSPFGHYGTYLSTFEKLLSFVTSNVVSNFVSAVRESLLTQTQAIDALIKEQENRFKLLELQLKCTFF